MKERLRTLWALRTSGQRYVISSVAALLGAALLLWLVQSANHARSVLRDGVTTLQADAMRLDRDAAEIERLRAAPPVTASHGDLRKLVAEQSDASGLSSAVTRLDAASPDEVSIVLGAVLFVDWLTLLQRLQAQQVRLESARMEALSTPGIVSVTATFTRSAAP